ncbi:MAG: hypothetical protein IKQ37_06445 [Bacteroidaceae bacterium]|nr:hypothetical protein [Bacteroidaceae bacterium]
MKRAYHEICLPDGTLQEGPVVVETDNEDRFLSWHKLQNEESFTEWIGGCYRVVTPNR